jgi:hypothetical protein
MAGFQYQGSQVDHWCTANDGLVKIQYECLVQIYVFPEMRLLGLIISKLCCHKITLYIPRIYLPILLQPNRQTDPVNMKIAHRYMNVGIGNEAAQFHF